jgi:hypothetical protein
LGQGGLLWQWTACALRIQPTQETTSTRTADRVMDRATFWAVQRSHNEAIIKA